MILWILVVLRYLLVPAYSLLWSFLHFNLPYCPYYWFQFTKVMKFREKRPGDFNLPVLQSPEKNVRWFQFTGTPKSWKKRPGDFNLPLLEKASRWFQFTSSQVEKTFVFWILESVQVISIYRLSVLKNTSVQFQFTDALSFGESVRVISIYRLAEKASVQFQFTGALSPGESVRVISIYRLSVLKKRLYNFNLPVFWVLEKLLGRFFRIREHR